MRAKTDGTQQMTVDFIRSILIHEMELDESRVNIYNQRYNIPTDDNIFILVGYNGAPKVIANRSVVVPSESDIKEYQEVNVQELIEINIMSRNLDAMRRVYEVLQALGSIYSQQIQERNGFKIFKNPSVLDLSGLEGSAMLNRYQMTFITIAWYSKIQTPDYYDQFSLELRTEKETVEIDLTES